MAPNVCSSFWHNVDPWDRTPLRADPIRRAASAAARRSDAVPGAASPTRSDRSARTPPIRPPGPRGTVGGRAGPVPRPATRAGSCTGRSPVPSPHRQAQHGFTRHGQLPPHASHQTPVDAQVVGDRAIRAGGVGADRVGGKLPSAHDHAARPFGTLAWWFLHGDLPAVIPACSSGTPFVTPKN